MRRSVGQGGASPFGSRAAEKKQKTSPLLVCAHVITCGCTWLHVVTVDTNPTDHVDSDPPKTSRSPGRRSPFSKLSRTTRRNLAGSAQHARGCLSKGRHCFCDENPIDRSRLRDDLPSSRPGQSGRTRIELYRLES